VAVLDESAALKERVSYSAYGRATHHWPGDWDGDGYVTAMDEDLIYIHGMEGAVVGDAEYDPDFDLNRDGVIDYDDALVGKYEYGRGPLNARISDPFGADNPIGYSGYIFNPETGLLLARHRYYHPQLGRWMSEDWLGYPDGMNRCEYVGSTPVAGIDPTGLFSLIGGARTSRIQETTDKYCAQQKRLFEEGKMCEDEFKKRWKNGGCDEVIGLEILKAGARGFAEGLGDGAVLQVNNLTLGLAFAGTAAQLREDYGHLDSYVWGDWIGWGGATVLQSIASTKLIGGLWRAAETLAFGRGPVSVFWVGGTRASAEATAWATTNGGRTIGQTTWGVLGRTSGAWDEVSASFASEAGRVAHVFVNRAVYNTPKYWASVWARIEYPILRANGTRIIWHYVGPG
jgi:RHS repeat-associated protein